ncbi:phosphatase PAP2 family protein [Paeniglutamicibacter cryotolerans]|nr:phosphatase PAP2 family protein [Paeniglutamicibacter cryotolerans]
MSPRRVPSNAASPDYGRGSPKRPGGRRVLWFVLVITSALFGLARRVHLSIGMKNGPASWDQPILEWMVAHRTPELNQLVTGFTNLGSTPGMATIAVIAVALLMWRSRSWWPLILVVVTAAGSLTLTSVLKQSVGRSRPPHGEAVPPYESSPSFPSGHTLNASAIIAVIAYLMVLQLRSTLAKAATITGLSLFIFLMGVSRNYLGLHWFTDVLAGWMIGLGWAALVMLIHYLVVVRGRHLPWRW